MCSSVKKSIAQNGLNVRLGLEKLMEGMFVVFTNR